MFSFVRSVFSESDGTGSMSRTIAFVSDIAVICWVTMVIRYTHAIPDLAGTALFLTASNAPYGVNKFVSNRNGVQPTEDKKP